MNDVNPAQFDSWLANDTFAALVIREALVPVEGPDGVFFPATYAPAKEKRGFPGGYNIDPPTGEKNVCLVDSVGSQANRIEPLFGKPEYAGLVPQITVRAGEKTVNLLEIGHRLGDALMRCTKIQKVIQDAFKAVQRGDMGPMSRLAPTSSVFGAWDSRDTQAKLPRLVASVIRAFDVQKLTRSAQYAPPIDYSAHNVFSEEDKIKAEGDTKNPLAQRGFVHNPATSSHGGVIAKGGIRRDATLSLAALRLLSTGTPAETLKLRRYILGLSLVVFTANPSTYLRQGTNLVPDLDKPRTLTQIKSDGEREEFKLTHAQALAYAKVVAKAFGVNQDKIELEFDKALAKADVEQAKKDAKKNGKKKKEDEVADETPVDENTEGEGPDDTDDTNEVE